VSPSAVMKVWQLVYVPLDGSLGNRGASALPPFQRLAFPHLRHESHPHYHAKPT
jgi:hypothetical protein